MTDLEQDLIIERARSGELEKKLEATKRAAFNTKLEMQNILVLCGELRSICTEDAEAHRHVLTIKLIAENIISET